MYAVIKTGGKQYLVKEKDQLKIEKIPTGKDGNYVFEQVLLVADAEAKSVKIGNPLVKGAKVEAKVLEQGRSEKVSVIKYKSKTRYRKNVGHRQAFTLVEITKVGV
ncbi:MAG: 50S ribosomal protein L21 [Patescibacteria group bacterium]|nr:50S ribosomal protein L21 [Patescibacteria group bacterium]